MLLIIMVDALQSAIIGMAQDYVGSNNTFTYADGQLKRILEDMICDSRYVHTELNKT